MIKLNKKVAFKRMVNLCGNWNTWSRNEHIAYGLIRGIDYERMEKYANDCPCHSSIARILWKLNIWEEYPYVEDNTGIFKSAPIRCYEEVHMLVRWNRKPICIKKTIDSEAAQ